MKKTDRRPRLLLLRVQQQPQLLQQRRNPKRKKYGNGFLAGGVEESLYLSNRSRNQDKTKLNYMKGCVYFNTVWLLVYRINRFKIRLQIVFIDMRKYNSEYSNHKYSVFKSNNEICNNEICKLVCVFKAIF